MLLNLQSRPLFKLSCLLGSVIVLFSHLALMPHCSAQPSLQTVLQQYQKQHEQFVQQLTEYKEIAVQTGDSSLQKNSETLLDALIARRDTVHLLPEALPEANSSNQSERLTQLGKLATEYATNLHTLGQQLTRKHPELAYQMFQETLRVDPHFKPAREKLGYVLSKGQWRTPYVQRLEELDYVDHPDFGWLKRNEVQRYEQGDRKYNGRWISADREAELRRSFRNAWTIRTEHFVIKTNHSLEAGVQLGRKLELFHTYFREIFLPVFNSPAQLQHLFESAGRVNVTTDSLHKVYYFRNRDEYIAELKDRVPNVDVTNALYWNDDRTAYSYYDETRPDFSSLYHEATHQLLYESVPKHRVIAATANFWIIEGIACYMETFRQEGTVLTAGNPSDPRVQQTLGQFIQDGWHMPLEQFVQLGREDFQTAPFKELQRRYGEAATLAYFFMDGQNGRYRQALLTHLADLYSINQQRRQQSVPLNQLTGQSYEVLDQQYRDFLTSKAQ